jgi:predicted ribosome quality control (RQC) complex YloA/Tae2 family protein
LRQLLKKKRKLRENLEKDASHFQNSTLCRKYADLLYALHVKPGPGLRTIQVPDLFDEKGGNLEIPLDPRKSVIQNANAYSRLHQKANRALPQIQDRLQKLQGEILRLEEKMSQLESAESLEELESIRAGKRRSKPEDRPVDQPGKGANRQAKDSPSSRPDLTQEIRKTAKVFLSSEGLTLLVGKSSRENDHLTQKIARPEDFWFHVANYGGSHVVLRNPARLSAPSRQSLLEAAQLAAYFSQARNASKVEVHYTQKKHVSKPRGTKPGLVVLKQYKSISVTPRLLETDAR